MVVTTAIPRQKYFDFLSFLSVEEIEEDECLKWAGGAILLGFYVTFSSWMFDISTTVRAVKENIHVCWPFFQDCGSIIFLSTLPDGYSQTIFFMILFGIMVAAVGFMKNGNWRLFHLALIILLIAKIYILSISYYYKGNYDYYHNWFCFLYIFLPKKRFFLRLSTCSFYFLSTLSKMHPSWLLGEYFTALVDGLPIFPSGSEVFMTNLVILMEMVFSWFLLSKNKFMQQMVFLFFCVFHLYSGILVGFRYPTTVMPMLVILFGPWFNEPMPAPIELKAIPGWVAMFVLVVFQAIPHLIPGDEALTMEGNFFGMYMFEGNHQCRVDIYKEDKKVKTYSSVRPLYRCDPYEFLFRAKNQFCSASNAAYKMIMIHSVNGEAFKEIVNEPDLCKLEYKMLEHNSWIRTELEAPDVGRPVKNRYR